MAPTPVPSRLGLIEGVTVLVVVSGLFSAFALVMNALNPDALIARRNLALFGGGPRLDSQYLSKLSADAWPELKASHPALAPAPVEAWMSGHLTGP